MSVWLVKTRRIPYSRDARVYAHTTTAMHKPSTPPLPPSLFVSPFFVQTNYWNTVVQETTTFTLPNPDEYERPEEIREIEVNRVKARSVAVEGEALGFGDKLRASLFGQLNESMSDWEDRDLRRSFVHMQVKHCVLWSGFVCFYLVRLFALVWCGMVCCGVVFGFCSLYTRHCRSRAIFERCSAPPSIQSSLGIGGHA